MAANESQEISMQRAGGSEHDYRGSSPRSMERVRSEEEIEKDAKVEGHKKFIDIFGRFIPFLYGTFALAILGMYIAGFVTEALKNLMIWCILGTSLISSLLGAWAVYRYGVIQDQINRLKEENKKYEEQINQLGETRKKLGSEVSDLQHTVHNLEHDAKELDEEAKEFEGLVEELKDIAGENEDILALLDNTNKIFNDMRKVVLENERAHLLSTFYECAFRDDDNRMDKTEYERFLGRLSKKQRDNFEKRGTFEEFAGKDGAIDLSEFQNILETVLQEVDELLKDEFSKQ